MTEQRTGAGDEIAVRAATLSDDAELAAIDRATWSPAISPAPVPSSTSSFFDESGAAGFLVATLGDRVVGYVTLQQPTRLAANRHVLAIHGLAVAPDAQRRGVGSQLLVAAVAHARAAGASRITLRVFASNATARRLYEAHGYVVEGILRGEFLLPAGNDGAVVAVDDVLMAKALS